METEKSTWVRGLVSSLVMISPIFSCCSMDKELAFAARDSDVDCAAAGRRMNARAAIMMRSLRIEIRHRYRLKKRRKILNGGGLDWFPARRAAPGPRNAWRNRPAGAVPRPPSPREL